MWRVAPLVALDSWGSLCKWHHEGDFSLMSLAEVGSCPIPLCSVKEQASECVPHCRHNDQTESYSDFKANDTKAARKRPNPRLNSRQNAGARRKDLSLGQKSTLMSCATDPFHPVFTEALKTSSGLRGGGCSWPHP